MTRHFGFPGERGQPVIWTNLHWEDPVPKPSRIGWAWEAAIVVSVGIAITLAVYGFIFFYR